VSNPITYDALLVHYLARELDERLRARRLRRVRFDSEHRRFTLDLDDARLVWELHPTRGWIRVVNPGTTPVDDGGTGDGADVPPEAAEGWGGRTIWTQRRPRVRKVTAPLDDRILELEIDAGGPGRASRFVVELMTNQWNVLALAPDRRIVSALWSREAGDRVLRTGAEYARPEGFEPRAGLDEPVGLDQWRQILEAVDPEDRARAMIRTIAWTSPVNAGPILDGGPDDHAAERDRLEAAWRRYRDLATRPEPHPHILELRHPTPYPLPLPGTERRPAMSLLAAFDQVAAADFLAPEVRAALEDRLERVTRRAARLHEEAERAPGRARTLRQRADLLMARLADVPRGSDTVELVGFDGDLLSLDLDPALSPVENAEALYDRARRRERAADQLPSRVRAAVAERNRLEAVLDALDEGAVDPGELARWIENVRPEAGGRHDPGTRLPYRRFRSSGGLEIRVGRSGRANDELTFHHSTPDDIWLHARDAAGAHVILRWTDRDQNPPRRDLLEAAVLAAVHSRARTSGTVPIDWTRRKYVRSPRKAPPGTVIPDRVATVFVEPDPELVERLAY
jgi:hypothetical protein